MTKSLLKRPFYLTAFCLLILSFSFVRFSYTEDRLTDSKGNAVALPDRPVIITGNPGMWQSVAAHHTPQIKTKLRYQGLETSREMIIRFPEPVREDEEDAIMKVYVREKDGFFLGFYEFDPGEQEFKMSMSAVINYVQIFTECKAHGLWRQDIRFEKSS
jgi:hypothetical protein